MSFRHAWDALAAWISIALAVFVVIGILGLVTAWVALRHARIAAQSARDRRVADAWMSAITEAQLFVTTADGMSDSDRGLARQEVTRRVAVAQGVSALDEAYPGTRVGNAVRERISVAVNSDDAEHANAQLRDARLSLRSWVRKDGAALKRDSALDHR